MAVLLSLETSTTVCSAALHENGRKIAGAELHLPQSASSKLAVMIDELLKLCDYPANRIEGVAVSAGPGSYTGLRIGVATAKGICYGLNVPLISVNTLELMVHQVVDTGVQVDWLCPMLDARRMEVYCLMADRSGEVVEMTDARVIDGLSFGNWLDRGVVGFFGNGSDKCREVVVHPNARYLDCVVPSALKLGELAFRKFEAKEFEELSSFEPFYLKDFVIKKPKPV